MGTSRSPFALFDDSAPADAAAVDIDPFSAEFFADPYPSHTTLREAGPVVWLTR